MAWLFQVKFSLSKSLENDLRRWETMWQSAEKKLPSNPFTSTWFVWRGCLPKNPSSSSSSLHTDPTNQKGGRWQVVFAHKTDQDLHQINDVWRALFRSPSYCYALPWDVQGRQDMWGPRLTLSGYTVWLMRYVEKRQKAIVDTAVPFIYFNNAFYFIFGFLVDAFQVSGMLQMAF